jgi:hypothetical protein
MFIEFFLYSNIQFKRGSTLAPGAVVALTLHKSIAGFVINPIATVRYDPIQLTLLLIHVQYISN